MHFLICRNAFLFSPVAILPPQIIKEMEPLKGLETWVFASWYWLWLHLHQDMPLIYLCLDINTNWGKAFNWGRLQYFGVYFFFSCCFVVLFCFLHTNVHVQPCFLQQLHPSATIQETQQWLLKHRFSTYTRLFSNFSGIANFSFIAIMSKFCVENHSVKMMWHQYLSYFTYYV